MCEDQLIKPELAAGKGNGNGKGKRQENSRVPCDWAGRPLASRNLQSPYLTWFPAASPSHCRRVWNHSAGALTNIGLIWLLNLDLPRFSVFKKRGGERGKTRPLSRWCSWLISCIQNISSFSSCEELTVLTPLSTNNMLVWLIKEGPTWLAHSMLLHSMGLNKKQVMAVTVCFQEEGLRSTHRGFRFCQLWLKTRKEFLQPNWRNDSSTRNQLTDILTAVSRLVKGWGICRNFQWTSESHTVCGRWTGDYGHCSNDSVWVVKVNGPGTMNLRWALFFLSWQLLWPWAPPWPTHTPLNTRQSSGSFLYELCV